MFSKMDSNFVNGGVTAKYFSLDRVARQEDPMTAFFLILCSGSVLRLNRIRQ